MDRIEVNVITGEKTVVELTPREMAEANARAAAEAARPVRSAGLAMVQQIAADPKAVAKLKEILA